MANVVEIVGIREIVRDAKASGDSATLGDLSDVWRKAERMVLARMQLRFAATGRRADAKVAATLRGSSGKDRAAVRFGSSSLPWWGGATFGAHHDRLRRTSRGTITGWNQFPTLAERRGGGPPYAAIRDVQDEIIEMVEREVMAIVNRDT